MEEWAICAIFGGFFVAIILLIIILSLIKRYCPCCSCWKMDPTEIAQVQLESVPAGNFVFGQGAKQNPWAQVMVIEDVARTYKS